MKDEDSPQLDATESVPAAIDLARKSGLIGAICSGVGDLSTSPQHFDGFGR